MKVLKANQEQYQQIDGFQKGVHKLEFAKDADGNWIVGVQVRDMGLFSEIQHILDELEEIEHNPIIEIE